MTLVLSIDPESQELEPLANINKRTALAIAPKWCGETLWFAGWNLYAVEGEKSVLLETYETEDEARWVRDSILQNIKAHAEMVIV